MKISECKYIIIDNDSIFVRQARRILEGLGVPTYNIWPPIERNYQPSLWSQVSNDIEGLQASGWDPERNVPIVLLLDLAIDEKDERVSDGISFISQRTGFFEKYVLLVYTKAPHLAELDQLKNLDGRIDKRIYSPRDDDPMYAANSFAETIRSAQYHYAKRQKIAFDSTSADCCIVDDDVNLRLFEREYGPFALEDLVSTVGAEITSNSTDKPIVKIASGGYSGSTVLLLEYFETGRGERRIAAKVSRNESELKAEINCLEAITKAAHIWHGYPVPTIGVKELKQNHSVFVLQQHYFKGSTLEKILLETNSSQRDAVVRGVGKCLREVGERSILQAPESDIQKTLVLSSDAVFKFQSSTTQLQTLYESGYLPHSVTSAFDVHAKSLPLLASHVANWPQLLATFAHCPALAYEQHGDLNPRNMMLNVNGRTEPQVQLIDFARFGVWPAFYDISRLRLQLSLRLLDPPDMLLDTFAERMILWDAAWNGAVRPSMHHTQVSLNGIESFLLLQSELMRVRNELTAKLPETQRPHIGGEAHFNLLLLYDLIKMVSYVDASTFKRMWYLLLAAKIAQESFPS